MKNPFAYLLALVGACAACCAIPIALPLIGGVALSGLGIARAELEIGVALIVFAAIMAAFYWRRRAAHARLTPSGEAQKAKSSCGC